MSSRTTYPRTSTLLVPSRSSSQKLRPVYTDPLAHPARRPTNSLFGDFDPFEMREEVAVAYRDFKQRWPRVKLLYWRGKPHEVDDLERVSVSTAQHIVLLGASRDSRTSDSLVLSALCALQCLPTKPIAEVIVEVALPQNVGVSRKIGGASARTITAKTAIDELAALSMRSVTAGKAMMVSPQPTAAPTDLRLPLTCGSH